MVLCWTSPTMTDTMRLKLSLVGDITDDLVYCSTIYRPSPSSRSCSSNTVALVPQHVWLMPQLHLHSPSPSVSFRYRYSIQKLPAARAWHGSSCGKKNKKRFDK